MATLPLTEILNGVRQLPNEYGVNQTPWDNPRADKRLIDVTRVRRIAGPRVFDSGPVPEGIPVYSAEEQERVGGVASGHSLDILAWYVSFHANPNLWGIYLSRTGIYTLANSYVGAGGTKHSAIEMAKRFLVRHESTHFQTDIGISSLELVLNKPIYLHALHETNRQLPPWNLREEGLANSLGRRALKSEGQFLDSVLDSSPSGYSDWRSFKGATDGWSWLSILQGLVDPIFPIANYSLASESSNTIAPKYFKDIPIYEVDDLSGASFSSSNYIGPIQNILETEEFLRDMKKLIKGQPIYKKKWENTKRKLAAGNSIGVHLELINKKDAIHSVQIDGEARAGIQKSSGWLAIAAGHHDELYRRLNSR